MEGSVHLVDVALCRSSSVLRSLNCLYRRMAWLHLLGSSADVAFQALAVTLEIAVVDADHIPGFQMQTESHQSIWLEG